MKEDVLSRVLEIYKKKSTSETQFAKQIGANQKTINQQLKGERSLSLDTVLLIINAFEDVSAEWLLRGTETTSIYPRIKELADIIRKYRSLIRQMAEEGADLDLRTFNHVVEGESYRQTMGFVDFAYSVLEKRKLRESTVRAHQCTLETLRRSGIIRTFDDLTPQNIRRFDDWLRKEDPSRQQPTIYGYHKRIKPYINEAIKLGIIEESPYARFKVSKGKHKQKEALNDEELQRLRDLNITDKYLARARDLFVFCSFTGLAYADMSSFDFFRHTVSVHGRYYIDGERIKTGTRYYTPILPPAMAVLEQYGYRLPCLTQQAYNRLLKCLGSMIGTRKNLSSHIARYTFATTVLLANEVPIESVSKMLGHSRIQITQLYAKILNSSIEKQAERLSEIL